MHRKALHSGGFVASLAALRKRQFTQGEVAALAGLSVPTVRLLEHGKGIQCSLNKVLSVLGLRIEGRNLPPAATIGQRVAKLRKRRGYTQRTLANAPSTVLRMEYSEASSIATLSAALDFLGAGTYLATSTDAAAFYTHAGNSSVNQAWRTPPALLDSLYAALGAPFDLDSVLTHIRPPHRASSGKSVFHGKRRRACVAVARQGVCQSPYGRTLRQWIAKAQAEVTQRRAALVVALVPARTETLWWHNHIAGLADAFMLRGRLSFGNGTPAPFPSALILWGASAAQIARMRAQFPTAWHVAAGSGGFT